MKKIILSLGALLVSHMVYAGGVPDCWNQSGFEKRRYVIHVNVDDLSKGDFFWILQRANNGLLKANEHIFSGLEGSGAHAMIEVEAYNFYKEGILSEDEFKRGVEGQLYGLLEINLRTHNKIDAFGVPISVTCKSTPN